MLKDFEEESRCDGCFAFKPLKITCLCADTQYCSFDCFKKDITHHKSACEADIGNKPEFVSNFELLCLSK